MGRKGTTIKEGDRQTWQTTSIKRILPVPHSGEKNMGKKGRAPPGWFPGTKKTGREVQYGQWVRRYRRRRKIKKRKKEKGTSERKKLLRSKNGPIRANRGNARKTDKGRG